MSKRIETKYTSGWFTVILPTIEFLLLWIGPPLLIFTLLDWNLSDWVAISICAGSLVPALAICVLTYPLLLRLAEHGRGELHMNGKRIRWRSGRRWSEVDLTKPYGAEIAAGHSGLGRINASISVDGDLMVHCEGLSRDLVQHAFPEPLFISEMASTPAEGLWGFNLDAADEPSRVLFLDLLDTLWETRENNECFRLFQKFPWGHRSRPDFHHIKVVEAKDCSADMKEFIAQLKSTVISAPMPWLSATPDYLLGEESNWPDTVKGETTRYIIMPLGCVHAEVTYPQPDWQSFLLGNLIIHALGGGSGTHRRLQDKYFLRIIGQDEHGRQLTVAVEWLAPGDEGYREGEYFVRFVNRWL